VKAAARVVSMLVAARAVLVCQTELALLPRGRDAA
jgi:hypothetical protein